MSSELPSTPTRSPEEKRPCTVGLTGGLATGKSTVARHLGDKGVPIFDADAVVHDLYEAGGAGAAAVATLFGAEVLDATGGVNRSLLSQLVLGNSAARRRLEKAVHPLVRRRLQTWLQSIDDHPIAVIEAALLIETGSFRDYDVLMVVWCEEHQQLQRARARGVPDDRLQGLIAAQLPIREKLQRADVLVDNRGDMEDLSIEIDRAWAQVRHLCANRDS